MNKPFQDKCWRLVHWNIQELDSTKLATGEHPQIAAASAIIESLSPDILTINEIHFDPSRAEHLGRDNVQDFLTHFPQGKKLVNSTFAPANTGLRAGRDKEGHYLKTVPDRGDARQQCVDRANFGLFPGQYASALATHLKIDRQLIIQTLRWKEWQPEASLGLFNFHQVPSQEIELFDKNFSVTWLDIMGTSVAIVCLHAVPAFDFGQKKSPNAARNEAQLDFLAWFLLGEPAPSPKVQATLAKAGIEPLSEGQRFIAVGDFNCPLDEPKYPGGKIIKRLLAHPKIQNRIAKIPDALLSGLTGIKPEHSFFSSGWDWTLLPTQLDYILVSQGITIEALHTYFVPPEGQAHSVACADEEGLRQDLRGQRRTLRARPSKIFGRGELATLTSVSEDFAQLRAASDHLPLYLDFKIT